MKKLIIIFIAIFTINIAHAQWVQTSLDSAAISAVAINGNNLFAGGEGMYLSTDSGNSWAPIDSGLTSLGVTTIAVNNNFIFKGGEDSGVYVSSNNGSSWSKFNNGIDDADV